MAILFTSDLHGIDNNSFIDCFKQNFIDKKNEIINDIKYHIILGDVEFKIPEKEKIIYCEPLTDWPFPILCVIGNHDPILGEKDLTKFEKDIGIGEKVYVINEEKPFVAYLKRGKVYNNIDGFKFLVLGGGLSIDKAKRKANGTWMKKEYWSIKEKWDLFRLLKYNNNFDYVLSHTGPHQINKILFGDRYTFKKAVDKVALMNDKINKKIQYRGWLCGHWHQEKEYPENISCPQYHYFGKSTLKKLSKENGGHLHKISDRSLSDILCK